MEKVKIDFLRRKYRLPAPRRSSFYFLGRFLLILAIFGAVGASALSYQIAVSEAPNDPNKFSLFSTLRGFMRAGDQPLQGEKEGRINFLFLGVGGTGHDGPQLSDTIMFMSYDPQEKKIGMISLPRDLHVPIPGFGWRKINHANAYGEQKGAGQGPILASQVVGQILKQEINYYVRVDFNGFAKFIDDIGGIDVEVERAFTDNQYPVLGMEDEECGTTATSDYACRFEALSFQAGTTHMDGATALKFVRSRHGSNGESSDFARSRRQQKVIAAVKDKVFSMETLLNLARINSLFATLSNHIATNLEPAEIIRLGRQMAGLNSEAVTTHVLDVAPDSPLYATTLNGAYVILPKNDDWEPLAVMAENIYVGPDQIIETVRQSPEQQAKLIRVEIQNGTEVVGLAFNSSQLLSGSNFEVVKIGNAAKRDYEQTVIYDLTSGAHPEELKILSDFLKAEVIMSAAGWMLKNDGTLPKNWSLDENQFQELPTASKVDFLVILGQNSSNIANP